MRLCVSVSSLGGVFSFSLLTQSLSWKASRTSSRSTHTLAIHNGTLFLWCSRTLFNAKGDGEKESGAGVGKNTGCCCGREERGTAMRCTRHALQLEGYTHIKKKKCVLDGGEVKAPPMTAPTSLARLLLFWARATLNSVTTFDDTSNSDNLPVFPLIPSSRCLLIHFCRCVRVYMLV